MWNLRGEGVPLPYLLKTIIMKSLKLISFLFISLVLLSCNDQETFDDKSYAENDCVNLSFKVCINTDAETRNGDAKYTFDGIIHHWNLLGKDQEENFTLNRVLPTYVECYITYENGDVEKKTSQVTTYGNSYWFRGIKFDKSMDPSKIKIRFCTKNTVDQGFKVFNKNLITATHKHPTYWSEDFYLANINDWDSIQKKFTIENKCAEFIIFSDEFTNNEDFDNIHLYHTLDYTQDRDVSEYLKNLLDVASFNEADIDLETKEIHYKYSWCGGNGFSLFGMKTGVAKGACGANIIRGNDDYLTINNKRIDVVGLGSILTPFTNTKRFSAEDQIETNIEGGNQLKYLVLYARESIGPYHDNLYKAVIPLSTLNPKRNCLYIIKNKAGKSIFTKCGEITRGEDNSCFVDMDDIEITEIPQ